MKQNKGKILPALALTVCVLGAGAAMAANGDESDPLVTLSYLNQVALPQVVQQVQQNMVPVQETMKTEFAGQVDAYKTEMQGIISAGAETTESGTYELVTVSKGQTITLDLGTEVLLRVGSCTVSCGANPALVDISTGGTLNKGSSLTKNHLYLATMTDRVLTATADTVKILVRGGYTVA